MNRASKYFAVVTATTVGVVLVPRLARSSDHQDVPAVTIEPAADLNDLYLWPETEGLTVKRVIFAVTASPNAPAGALFSDHVQYAIHTTTSSKFGPRENPRDVICTFKGTAAPQLATCWFGNELVARGAGDTENGISSEDGKLRVFAGARRDAFFFNSEGFKNAIAVYQGVEATLPFTAGCGEMTTQQATTMRGKFEKSNGGGTVNHFAGWNALTIVVSLDASLFSPETTPYVSAWASTHKAP